MKLLLRNVGAVLGGLVIGSIVNMAVITIGPQVIPPPAGIDMTSAEGLAASAHLLEPKHFVFPFLAHAAGTFAGALVAHLMSGGARWIPSVIVAVVFMAGGVAAAFMIPAPKGFIALDLLGAYLPMAWLATIAGRQIRPLER